MSESPAVSLRQSRRDRLSAHLSPDGAYRTVVVIAPVTVREGSRLHGLNPLTTVLLGEALLAALLDAGLATQHARSHLQWKCAGPVKGISAEATTMGEVRGFVERPAATVDAASGPEMLAEAVGLGVLRVVRIRSELREPSQSSTALMHSRTARDMADFYAQSDQIPTAMRIEVDLDPALEVDRALGILIQRVPDTAEPSHERVVELEERLRSLDVRGLPREPIVAIEQILDRLFGPQVATELRTSQVDFFCPCSAKYYESKLITLGVEELRSMAADGPQSITCHYCARTYEYSSERLNDLAVEALRQN